MFILSVVEIPEHYKQNMAEILKHSAEEVSPQVNPSKVTEPSHEEIVLGSQEIYNYDRVEENKCKLCEGGRFGSRHRSSDHEDLHLLQDKEVTLKRENEILREKIVSSKAINIQLKEKYENRLQLHSLEQEGMNYETGKNIHEH